MCNQLDQMEQNEIVATNQRATDERNAMQAIAQEREQNRVVAECQATMERSREEYHMRLAEYEAVKERMRVAEIELQRAEVVHTEAASAFQTESATGIAYAQEARGCEVNLINSKAEEDRAVKERAAVESTSHEAYHLGAPLGPAGGYPYAHAGHGYHNPYRGWNERAALQNAITRDAQARGL